MYAELRGLAAAYLKRERPGHTLQATALVHEAYLKLMGQAGFSSRDRTHVAAMAANAIRRILVDHARTRGRQKRGGQRGRVPLVESAAVADAPGLDLLDLDGALSRLAGQSPERARIVEMRFFAGMSAEEIGRVLGVSSRTVERDWRYARAWLYRELGSPDSGGSRPEPPAARDPGGAGRVG
jgi:RNA polymerase sigma factor (TIGR02999 family)